MWCADCVSVDWKLVVSNFFQEIMKLTFLRWEKQNDEGQDFDTLITIK